MIYHELLNEYIKKSGLSLRQISEQMKNRGVKIDKSYISKLQNGVVNPPSLVITLALADVTGGEPEKLVQLAQSDGISSQFLTEMLSVSEDLMKKSLDQKWLLEKMSKLEMLEKENKELKSMVLWSARRLHKTYKGYIYDDYEKVTGEKPERL
ncbi:helix-turn-helix domain-containing protein [Bacillus mesophilum]|uniref:Uncharacterized protein n=1 Tax=Bacillus mesophilum TaxID=1071718 RepID=A0A7V7RNW7_9BACI|nr:helix-turn-helix domain-containing protein [Bacillus mesophilum]KAB2334280.1 hypothetical protein F7732_09425 [Bacillus mesophilum]